MHEELPDDVAPSATSGDEVSDVARCLPDSDYDLRDRRGEAEWINGRYVQGRQGSPRVPGILPEVWELMGAKARKQQTENDEAMLAEKRAERARLREEIGRANGER